jgi:hypothetical protein
LDSKLLTRTVVAGGVLALLGIGLFFLFWVVLGSLGTPDFARVVLSVCIPPILMAAGVGAYFLLVRPSPSQEE